MGEGEFARYEQFLLFRQCFQKACFPGASDAVIVWEWVKTWNRSAKGKTIVESWTQVHVKSIYYKSSIWYALPVSGKFEKKTDDERRNDVVRVTLFFNTFT